MIIKVGDEFLDFDDEIIVEKQLFDYSTLETAGSFSYSFQIKDTSYNRKILGITDLTNNENICLVDNVQILTDSGIPIYIGFIMIDDPIGIDCSFFSDNCNFFTSIQGNVSDLDRLSRYDVQINEANIVASWSADNGVVFPLCDRGGVYRRKDPFMKLRIRDGRMDQNDWQPFIFVKDVMNEILTKANLKMDGDLINDGTYQKLITTNSSQDAYKRILAKQNIYVGTEASQTIPNGAANAIKVSFELYGTLPFFNSDLNNFDPVLNRWTLTYDSTWRLSVAGVVSDNTKEIHWDFRRTNGTSIITVHTKASSVNFNSDSSQGVQYDDTGEGIELWAYVDSSTPGTADIVSLNMQSDVRRTNTAIAQALIPSMTSSEFVADILKMFGVTCDFDQFTRTIHTRLSSKIDNGSSVDLSQYVHNITALRNSELINNYAQSNILKYSPLEGSEPIEEFNKRNAIPYGGAEILIDNSKLEKDKDLIELKFKAPFCYKHEGFGLYLVRLDFISYDDATAEDDTANGRVSVTSVTDNGGLAQFNTATVNITTNNNAFVDDATGFIEGLSGGLKGFGEGVDRTSQYQENDSDNQVVCIYLKDVALPNSFNFSQNTNSFFTGWPIIRISEMTNPVYNGDWELTTMDIELRSSAGVAIFAKANDGTVLDVVRQGLSFGDIDGLNSLTLKETFYKTIEESLNNPVKPVIEMLIPEKVFLNLDFTNPVRIETERLNGVFMINKCTGYKDSVTPCTFEIIKNN